MMSCACGQVIRKKYEEKNFFLCILTINEDRSRIRSWIRIPISQKYGPKDPDPHKNVTDPQHCLAV
jgi:hypothetical protein